jgi:hypothetical protein
MKTCSEHNNNGSIGIIIVEAVFPIDAFDHIVVEPLTPFMQYHQNVVA